MHRRHKYRDMTEQNAFVMTVLKKKYIDVNKKMQQRSDW